MALIKCSECGQMISDKASSCPHCGCPLEQQVFNEINSMENHSGKYNAPTYFSNYPSDTVKKTSTTGTSSYSINTTQKRKKNSKAGCLVFLIAGILFVFFFIIIIVNIDTESDSTVSKSETVETKEDKTNPDNSKTNEDVASTNSEAATENLEENSDKTTSNNSQKSSSSKNDETKTESKKDYLKSCKKYDYKSLLRTPDDYIGKRIKVKLKIYQTIESSFFDDTVYYRCYTDNNDYGLYFDDEYYIADCRNDSDLKLLDDDIITVYGEYTGAESITRALTLTEDSVPSINMYYVKLHEDTTTE